MKVKTRNSNDAKIQIKDKANSAIKTQNTDLTQGDLQRLNAGRQDNLAHEEGNTGIKYMRERYTIGHR